jgi:hypothetical protein
LFSAKGYDRIPHGPVNDPQPFGTQHAFIDPQNANAVRATNGSPDFSGKA